MPDPSPSVAAPGTRAVDRAALLVATVVHADEPLTFADLQETSGLAKSTTSRMLTALEKDGDVRRLVSGEDRRQRLVEVTPQGDKALAALQLIVDLLRDGVMQDLDRDELETGMRILNKLLARLEAEGFGSKPPVAYRALGFLVENGFAHRIEGLSAFVACDRPGAAHAPSFLVCRACRRVAEEAVAAPLAPEAEAEGFAIERTVIEAQGLCPACQEVRP